MDVKNHKESVQQIIFRAEVNESGDMFEDVRSGLIRFFVFVLLRRILNSGTKENMYLYNSFELFLIYASDRRKCLVRLNIFLHIAEECFNGSNVDLEIFSESF